MRQGSDLQHTARSVVILVCLIGLFAIELPKDSMMGNGIGVQPANAADKYGILGRSAPELNLDGWIDGDGNKIAPINLHNYLGKVVYLYFFQDW